MTEDDAIQMDVSAEEEIELSVDAESEQQKEPSEREKALKAIQDENLKREGRLEAEEPMPEEELPESSGEEVSEELQAAPDPLDELGYYRKPDGKLYTKMKIRGEEREVRADQVKAYLQKDISAEEGLQQVAEERRRLQEERERFAQEREARLKQSLSQPSMMDADEAKAKADALIKKIYEGDESAAEDLAALMNSKSATLNPDDIAAIVESKVLSAQEKREAEKRQIEWNNSVSEGIRALEESRPEIFGDQELFSIVDSKTAQMVELQQQGDPDYINLTPAQIIEKAATDVQAWLDGRTTPKKEPATSQRQARKDGLKPIPNSNGRQFQKAPKPELDTSTEAILSRMKKSRAV